MNDQVQARVGGRQEMDGGRTPQEKSMANSRRENLQLVKEQPHSGTEGTHSGRKSGLAAGKKEEAHHRPQVKESGETLERRRARASSIVTRGRREACEEAAVLQIIQVVDSQSGEVVITVPTVGYNDARTRVPSCGTWEARTRPDL